MVLRTPSSRAALPTCKQLDRRSDVSPCSHSLISISLANGFAYWQDQDISNATATYFDDMAQAKARIEQVAGDNAKKIRFGNGESGWPTGMLPFGLIQACF